MLLQDFRMVRHARSALPFWMSLGLVPLAIIAAWRGEWWFVLMPAYAWYPVTGLDAVLGLNKANLDPETSAYHLFWHRAITAIWFPIQATVIFGAIWFVTHAGHLTGWEKIGLFFGIGVMSGTIGIVYAHELLHQRPRWERWMGDLLLASTLYAHFRSEHLLVHHAWVGTPRDAVSARYDESFWRFFPRVLLDCPRSAWRAERRLLARAGRPVWYLEHYGLTRLHFGGGRYEHVLPRHSWNTSHTASNWLLINLQRHSDHHYKPDRRFPLLQTYGADEAPQLPFGYPLMTFVAMIPGLWRRRMNPRVRAWRRQFYPGVTDWTAYDRGELPLPRGAL
ncbi:alkane 1-monooxygenase [uncultured Paracoccus sp.]|uniref:alkane 1-monooxygenase n=1 Tax=uncultured Paracoccus sp. TaxID=189685 RepID=UPI00262B61FA|nr:alkane 1-monooxygenase [uncultured Paracoccus sp.]